jgi:hypothetical protein
MTQRRKRLPDADLVIIQAERRNVEEADIRPTLANLKRLLNADNRRDYFERVEFCVDGYDSDPRELCEIPEIREWMDALDKEFPYWFLFLHRRGQSLGFVTFALCPYIKMPGGGIFMDPLGLRSFMMSHFAALNRLVDQGVLSERDNLTISEHVADYYAGQMRPVD